MELEKREPQGWELRIKPDMAQLAELINKAKGELRTMAQLAEESGTSASTLSRKVNQKAERPIPFELLERIATASEGRVSIDDLLYADGYRKIRTRQPYGTNDPWDKIARKNSITTLISNLLVSSGARVAKVNQYAKPPANLSQYCMDIGYPPLGGLVFETDLFPGFHHWMVIPCSYVSEDADGADAVDKMSVMFGLYSTVFLLDQWMPEILNGVRTTIVIPDEIVYKEFMRMLIAMHAHFYNTFTVMWVDVEKGEIVDESILGDREVELFADLAKQ